MDPKHARNAVSTAHPGVPRAANNKRWDHCCPSVPKSRAQGWSTASQPRQAASMGTQLMNPRPFSLSPEDAFYLLPFPFLFAPSETPSSRLFLVSHLNDCSSFHEGQKGPPYAPDYPCHSCQTLFKGTKDRVERQKLTSAEHRLFTVLFQSVSFPTPSVTLYPIPNSPLPSGISSTVGFPD